MHVPRALIFVVAVAIFVRLIAFGAAWHLAPESIVAGDSVRYVELASNIIDGKGFVTLFEGTEIKEVFRTPGFPLLLAPFTLTPAPVFFYGLVALVIAGALLPLLTYAIGRRVGGVLPGLVAAWLIALEPHAVMYSFLPQTEVPFMIVTLGGLLAALLAYERLLMRFAVLAGALIGFGALIRPGLLHIFIASLLATLGVLWWRREHAALRMLGVIAVAFFVVLSPWYLRNHEVTGVWALSGGGWRNVYTDYLASLRALESGRTFHEEKEQLKDEALPRFGIDRAGVGNPANAATLRDAALAEMWQHKLLVVKLETTLLVSFFFNDGYYYQMRNLGYLPDPGNHISPTYELLTRGIAAIPAILEELSRQAFVPILGRIFTTLTFVGALAAPFVLRTRLSLLLAGVIALMALESTVIGFGLDARMRVPIEPYIFMLFGASAAACIAWYKERYAR